MPTIDIFRSDAFSLIEMSAYVNRTPYAPTGLGLLNIFDPTPLRTTILSVEEEDGVLGLVPVTERGAPTVELTRSKRRLRGAFKIPRLAEGSTINSADIQNIRASNTATELQQVQDEVVRRLDGPGGIRQRLEMTREYMRLGAIRGQLRDAPTPAQISAGQPGDLIYDWYNEFGIATPAPIAFDLKNTTADGKRPGYLRRQCNSVVRSMQRAAKGAWLPSTQLYAMCGDAFWDELTTHPDVEKTYLNWASLQDGATRLREGTAFDAMSFGGINWFNYRGSDDGVIGLAQDQVRFFPVGAPGVFQEAMAPGEGMDAVNTLGQKEYAMVVVDPERNFWARPEVYSYPLFICTRPEMLLSGVMGAS
ncbi:Hypothetical protein GbCGDNIH3_7062 [Granulibacter bethesdensis]|uniref:Major capsid protein n=1 Tax=Granulibacter bethesdensis TaxID=364410 RepID=A0AAN0VFY2_9PROT|nr:major capsid protein [Granulibacter bethesdensis]AHJ63246.1 Hypothetical protein GbCGDNIH3_7062 [Granulibacter bethesdensis]